MIDALLFLCIVGCIVSLLLFLTVCGLEILNRITKGKIKEKITKFFADNE